MQKIVKSVQCERCGSKDDVLLTSGVTAYRCRFCAHMVKVQEETEASSAAKDMHSHTDKIEKLKKPEPMPIEEVKEVEKELEFLSEEVIEEEIVEEVKKPSKKNKKKKD